MDKEQILKKKIEMYFLIPIIASSILVLLCIGMFFIDTRCAWIATIFVAIVLTLEI